MKRIVITGLGMIHALGDTKDSFKAIVEGECGIDKITLCDTSELDCKIAAEVTKEMLSGVGGVSTRISSAQPGTVASQAAVSPGAALPMAITTWRPEASGNGSPPTSTASPELLICARTRCSGRTASIAASKAANASARMRSIDTILGSVA